MINTNLNRHKMTAKEYLESKGLNDHDYMDSGMINHISEMMEEYHKFKQFPIQRELLIDFISKVNGNLIAHPQLRIK